MWDILERKVWGEQVAAALDHDGRNADDSGKAEDELLWAVERELAEGKQQAQRSEHSVQEESEQAGHSTMAPWDCRNP